MDASVHMTMTALARPRSVIISLRKSSPMVRLVSHHVVQPSASSIEASFNASGRSVLAYEIKMSAMAGHWPRVTRSPLRHARLRRKCARFDYYLHVAVAIHSHICDLVGPSL